MISNAVSDNDLCLPNRRERIRWSNRMHRDQPSLDLTRGFSRMGQPPISGRLRSLHVGAAAFAHAAMIATGPFRTSRLRLRHNCGHSPGALLVSISLSGSLSDTA